MWRYDFWLPMVESRLPRRFPSLKARTDHSPLKATATMVDTAAAEIDQVISRNMGRLMADRYYGLLCL